MSGRIQIDENFSDISSASALKIPVYSSLSEAFPVKGRIIDVGDVLYLGTGISWVQSLGAGVTTFSAGTTGLLPNVATAGAVTLSGTLIAANGGTGFGGATPYTIGDILYADTTSTLARLADVAVNNALISGGVGVAPTWGQISNATLVNSSLTITVGTGLLGGGNVALGGTVTLNNAGVLSVKANAGLAETGTITLLNGTNVSIVESPAGTFTFNATGAGGVTTFSAGTTGLLPNIATAGAITLTGTLIAANGGTGFGGANPYAVGDLLYANTTSTLARLADVAVNNALISGGVGVAPTWGQINNATLANSSLTVTAGTGLSGGGNVALGSSITLNNAGVLSVKANAGVAETGSLTLLNGTNVSIVDSPAGTFTFNVPTGAGGVTTFSAGTTGFTPNIATSGAITLAGTLGVTNGGTGITTVPTNGQIPIGNGTTYTAATLTAGPGVSVTNAAGSVTISANTSTTPTTLCASNSETSVGGGPGVTVGYIPWQNSAYSSYTTRTVVAWVIPSSSAGKDLTISVLPAGGPSIGSITINGGSAVGAIYTFTFTNPGVDTNLQFSASRTGGAGTNPLINGLIVKLA